MVLSSLFVLLLLSLLLYVARRRRFAFVGVVLFMCGLLLAGTGFFPALLLSKLQTYPRIENANWGVKRTAIFVLGSGGMRRTVGGAYTSSFFGVSRVFEAARLYHECTSLGGTCVLVPCGGDALKMGITEAELMKRELTSAGVPEASILLEPKSVNTFQNALFARETVQGKGFERYILVTSGIHMARAVKFFQFFGLDVEASASDELTAYPSILPKVLNIFLVEASLHELGGILKFHVYNLMGWNVKPA